MATWTNSARNAASFTNTSRSLRTYGALTNDEIGTFSNESIINGKAIGDYTNDDTIGPIWSNTSRS